MRRFDELETAVLHERDVAATELDLEQVGVVRGAHQHGLAMERGSRFPVFEYALGDVVRFCLLILCGDEQGLLRRVASGEKVLPKSLTPIPGAYHRI